MGRMEVNVREAKQQLSRLLQRVAAGEEITITRAGKPIAKLTGIGPAGVKRPLGMDRGKIWIAEDFDAPNPEIEALFYDAPFATNESGEKRKKR